MCVCVCVGGGGAGIQERVTVPGLFFTNLQDTLEEPCDPGFSCFCFFWRGVGEGGKVYLEEDRQHVYNLNCIFKFEHSAIGLTDDACHL